MKKVLIGDTETTGMPDWPARSGEPHQPHMVQLAAVVCDADTKKPIESMDVIIRPDGWEIPPDMTEIHGITTEHALDVGIPERLALEMFMDLLRPCYLRVFHNTTFDNRIIRIALKRYFPDLIPDEVWKDKAMYYCTLQHAKKIMGGKSGHTLGECYKHFIGVQMKGAHTAMGDTLACMELYFVLKRIG